MSDENEFMSEDESKESSISDTEQEASSFEDVEVETPQAQESYEATSVRPESRDEEGAADSDRLPVQEQLEEIREDNESVGEDISTVKPETEATIKRAKRRKTRKPTGKLTSPKPQEILESPKMESSAVETIRTQINERLKLNEQKLSQIMSAIRPLERHIHSTAMQAQLSRQIQIQVKQLQKQVQQIEKMSKNISSEIKKRANKGNLYTLQKRPSKGTAIGKSKGDIKSEARKKAKTGTRRKSVG